MHDLSKQFYWEPSAGGMGETIPMAAMLGPGNHLAITATFGLGDQFWGNHQ